MLNHKTGCFITMLLVFIGGLNWGLVGLGGLLNKDLNVVNMLLGSWPTIEYIVYILVGLAALIMAYAAIKCSKHCACHKCK